jgi:hypothetical protein
MRMVDAAKLRVMEARYSCDPAAAGASRNEKPRYSQDTSRTACTSACAHARVHAEMKKKRVEAGNGVARTGNYFTRTHMPTTKRGWRKWHPQTHLAIDRTVV